ncbi:site-specific integrase [Nocardia sp. XZ_19_385]|uniref:tyrosine-type recombinase/integrase n=1 Tax=Nocardia sp. XZ_19_385 TaxID=2769488 RepID=UPI0028163F7F|nr:site-specific integrase [Nocardia sp. XZ_19_385]
MASVHEYQVKPDPKIKGDKGIRYRVAYNKPDGKPTGKRGFLRKAEANAFANKVEVKKMDGEYVAPSLGRVTVSELAPAWLKGKKASTAPSNYRTLDAAWRTHVEPRWGSVRIADINLDSVEEWVTDMRLAAMAKAEAQKAKGGKVSDGATTIIRAHGVLAGILDAAVKAKRLPKNLARGVENLPDKKKKRHVYLTSADLDRLAKQAGKNDLLVLMLGYCGPRWGELIALRVRDIDFRRARITVADNAVQLGVDHAEGETKGKEIRTVPVPKFILDQLQEHVKGRDRNALVFPHPGDAEKYLPRPKSADGWFAGAVKRSKVQPITPHDLRHTCASLAVSAGANVLALARLLGHKDAKETLNTYADLFDDDLDRVALAMNEKYSGGKGSAETSAGSCSCQILVTERNQPAA